MSSLKLWISHTNILIKVYLLLLLEQNFTSFVCFSSRQRRKLMILLQLSVGRLESCLCSLRAQWRGKHAPYFMLLTRFIIIEEGQLSLCEILTLKYLLLLETILLNQTMFRERLSFMVGPSFCIIKTLWPPLWVFSTHFTCAGSVRSLANQVEVSVTGVGKRIAWMWWTAGSLSQTLMGSLTWYFRREITSTGISLGPAKMPWLICPTPGILESNSTLVRCRTD